MAQKGSGQSCVWDRGQVQNSITLCFYFLHLECSVCDEEEREGRELSGPLRNTLSSSSSSSSPSFLPINYSSLSTTTPWGGMPCIYKLSSSHKNGGRHTHTHTFKRRICQALMPVVDYTHTHIHTEKQSCTLFRHKDRNF